MTVKNICICAVEAPFVRGGAEIQLDSLAQELRDRGYNVARVTLPFVWLPMRNILKNALMWRWIELERCTSVPIDLVICSKFPSYAVKHPRKVTWLIHQFRQAYELYGTPHSPLTQNAEDQAIRQSIIQFDNQMLAESRAIFTESKNVARRLKKYNGLAGIPLYHPPQRWDLYHHREYGNYILSVGRLVPLKRVDLLIEALARPGIQMRAVIVGEGPELKRLQELVEKHRLQDRVDFTGACWGKELVDLYARARAVYYAPYDEDYGLVVPEAFKSYKPVITTTDAGGTLEFVFNDQTGCVTEPNAEAVAQAIAGLQGNDALCARLGAAGCAVVRDISWDHVISQLVGAA